jgi:hypothetical protein
LLATKIEASLGGFVWKWRASNGKQQSASTFVYFYDCVENARCAGYAVELDVALPKTPDGSSHAGIA